VSRLKGGSSLEVARGAGQRRGGRSVDMVGRHGKYHRRFLAGDRALPTARPAAARSGQAASASFPVVGAVPRRCVCGNACVAIWSGPGRYSCYPGFEDVTQNFRGQGGAFFLGKRMGFLSIGNLGIIVERKSLVKPAWLVSPSRSRYFLLAGDGCKPESWPARLI